jgi:hypothetical protein
MREAHASMTAWDGLTTERAEDGGLVIKGESCVLTPTADGSLQIDGSGPCGRSFPNIGRVLEPTSANPALELSVPLGINGVADILRCVLARQTILEMQADEAKEQIQ